MSGLKQLRARITSVKSTQKITKAMQLVSAVKLTKIKNHIVNSAHYVNAVHHMMENLLVGEQLDDLPESERKFLSPPERNDSHLLIVVTSEKGLCGLFNSVIIKLVKSDIATLEKDGKTVKLIIIGKKAYDAFKIKYSSQIDSYFALPKLHDDKFTLQIKNKIMELINNSEIGNCRVYFNKFKNAMIQIPTMQQVLPIQAPPQPKPNNFQYYEYEGENLVSNMINLYITSQVNYALLQSRASEEGARMTAMENAMNNAKDIMSKFRLQLNRSRQAMITNELIEIISGAESV